MEPESLISHSQPTLLEYIKQDLSIASSAFFLHHPALCWAVTEKMEPFEGSS
jgi:hypothetical protein